MEVHVIEGIAERSAISSLCLNTQVLAAIAPGWTPDCFPSKWANIVGGWAAKYYNEYKEAPGVQGITALYADWAAGSDSDTAGIVNKWLTALDPDQSVNPEYAIGQIQKIITKTAVKRITEKVTGAIGNNKLDAAIELLDNWKRPIAASQQDYLSIFENIETVKAELESANQEPLFTYKGAFGQYINPLLIRDAFVAFLSPTGRGKSTFLMDFAVRAAAQGNNVAFFTTGDLSRGQVLRRLQVKFAGKPLQPGAFYVPKSVQYEGKEPKVERAMHHEPNGLSPEEGVAAFKKAAGRFRPDAFRLECASAGTITAADIANKVEKWAEHGWVADVVVIDYADILAGLGKTAEPRDQINNNWIAMRAMSTDFHNLVITATQADTEGMDTWCLSLRNFNGDRRKWDHCTAVMGINVTPVEKKLGVARFNHLKLREAEFASDLPHMVAVAGCTKVGAPVITSCFVG